MQARAEVIWLTDNKLYSRDGTIRIVSNIRFFERIIFPSPIIGRVLPSAMEIIDYEHGKIDCN